jgi:adenylate kinase family enzyme
MPPTVSPYIWISRRYESKAKRAFPVRSASPFTATSPRPTLRIVSIIPGIEIAAPERTDTRSGSWASPKSLPVSCSSRSTCSAISSSSPAGIRLPFRMYSRQASVVIVNPAGTGSPSCVISASPRPLPPSSSRPPAHGSEKSKTYRIRAHLPTGVLHTRLVRRVAVTASASGNGKTTVGRTLAARLGVPFVELDSLVHGPGWTEISDEDLRRLVEPIVAGEDWVVDGSYRRKIGDLVLARADTVVWLDLPMRVWVPRLLRRTMRRIRGKERLWNDNKETFRLAFVGRESLFGYAFRSHFARRRRCAEELAAYPVVRLRSQAEVDRFLSDVGAP